MKKILIILVLLLLVSCNNNNRQENSNNERYTYLIELINEHEEFLSDSTYFDIAVEMAKISDGYRYYVTVDNPRLAMYDVELLAIEKNVDYSSRMAANIGIFEDTQYNIVPNQANPSKGYVKGVVASGVTNLPNTTLYIFVQFKNADYTTNHVEYFKIDVSYEG